ncbi:MAG: hypothetical protein QM757_36100 [Paludibaculum sp.]
MERLNPVAARGAGSRLRQGWPLAGAAMVFLLLPPGGAGLGQTPDNPAGDALLRTPFVDADEWRDTPVRHRYVHGGFQGTEARFSLYFPPKERYQGRFFQHVTPTPIDEKNGTTGAGTGDQIGFAFASGGYFLVTNQGGMAAMRTDPSLGAYRVNAAAAQYARVLAGQMYGPGRVYGYAYGGSGGAFRTIGGIENTRGVWDGVVPYVVGSPQAIPNVFTARLLALRVLGDRFAAVLDAIEPGGRGPMDAALDEEQRAVLAEVSGLGFPLKGWFNYQTIGMGAFPILFDLVVQKDPAYFEEFWKVAGYEGANPSESLRRARVRQTTTVKRLVSKAEADRMENPVARPGESRGGVDTAWQQMQGPPAGFELENVPAGDLRMATVTIRSGEAAGASFPLGKVAGNTIFTGTSMAAMMAGRSGQLDVLKRVKPGDELQFDNSNFLAVQYYHRHQVPTPDFYVWNQFRNPNGTPRSPQRPRLIGPEFAASAGGTTQSGRFEGKMIVVESLWDQDAFPWQADWYAGKVRAALGPRFDQNFRLYFIDHALHGDVERQADPAHTVSYVGALQQALRDLSAWVEKGVVPPASTNYRVDSGQVTVPATAAERKGLQPVVTLRANGQDRAEVRAGATVTLSGRVQVPPHTGQLVAIEWDAEGTGRFEPASLAGEGAEVAVKLQHAYTRPGTWFAVLRATSQREGDGASPYARIGNLARVRVVVR